MQREFYIPRLQRERSIYGTEFEMHLKNDLNQKAIAKECVEWIKNKVTFRSVVDNEQKLNFINVDGKVYKGINGFTTVDLGCTPSDDFMDIEEVNSPRNKMKYLKAFEDLWNDTEKLQEVTKDVLDRIERAYKENSPEFIYYYTLYHVFNKYLEESEDNLPNEATGFKKSQVWQKLYNFQQDAVLAIINRLEKYNGCILADSVGLGKTFSALAVIKYYENRNKNVLVLCPKKLAENWNTYKDNYIDNPLEKDRLRYDVLFHTDLSRKSGKSNGIDLSKFNWGNYDLVVIDESHNFKNGGTGRYSNLMKHVIKAGVKTKVLMLSATPVNNNFTDLKRQLELAYEGNAELIDEKLDTTSSINEIFRQAQRAFNAWSKLEEKERTTEALQKALDFDFFELLDSVTIARSRKHIEKYYNVADIGSFPQRLKPISQRPNLTDLDSNINYKEISSLIVELKLAIYTPSNYFEDSWFNSYEKGYKTSLQTGESNIKRLMAINLLKRLESSVSSFKETIEHIRKAVDSTIKAIDKYQKNKNQLLIFSNEMNEKHLDEDEQNTDLVTTRKKGVVTIGKKLEINLENTKYVGLKKALEEDLDILNQIIQMIDKIAPEHDTKLQTLYDVIDEKINNPINKDNKKVIIFTAFADTADYLYDNVSKYVQNEYGLHTAKVTGDEIKTTVKNLNKDLNAVLTHFSPLSKGKALLKQTNDKEIDILIATDCISEGQNLQDCDYLVNYDIHWNPVRIIQRFGRIDRIGSKNTQIQLVNFWPNVELDEYLNLKSRVESRMRATVMSSTGDDNLLNAEENNSLKYRDNQVEQLKKEKVINFEAEQLKQLETKVMDLEDMSTGISIMDLGLNEFRFDLLEYHKKYHTIVEKTPTGIHAVVPASNECEPGVIFILKKIKNSEETDSLNRIHPYYCVYINKNGETLYNYLDSKHTLNNLRLLCKGKTEPIKEICKQFNKRTKNGRDMEDFTLLLNDAIVSIMDTKEESEIDSLFTPGGTSALVNKIVGLDDFELICFVTIE